MQPWRWRANGWTPYSPALDLLELSTQIKQRAMDPFPVQVRTLDALHIATALAVAADASGTALFSHDKGMNLCARCLGIPAALA